MTKIDFKITFDEKETIIKQEEVNGVRRKPLVHLSLTPAEAKQVERDIEGILYRINAGRAVLTVEEAEKLPQPSVPKKVKEEVME